MSDPRARVSDADVIKAPLSDVGELPTFTQIASAPEADAIVPLNENSPVEQNQSTGNLTDGRLTFHASVHAGGDDGASEEVLRLHPPGAVDASLGDRSDARVEIDGTGDDLSFSMDHTDAAQAPVKPQQSQAAPLRDESTATTSLAATSTSASEPQNLFVRHIPMWVGDRELRAGFERFGRVVSASIMRHIASGDSKGHGFVMMSTAEEAQAAIEGGVAFPMQNAPTPATSLSAEASASVSGAAVPGSVAAVPMVQCVVMKARHSGANAVIADRRRVFVSNVPQDLTVPRLRDFFDSQFGGVVDCIFQASRVAPQGTCIAFVEFAEPHQAQDAIAAVHGTRPFGEQWPPLLLKISETKSMRHQRHSQREQQQHQHQQQQQQQQHHHYQQQGSPAQQFSVGSQRPSFGAAAARLPLHPQQQALPLLPQHARQYGSAQHFGQPPFAPHSPHFAVPATGFGAQFSHEHQHQHQLQTQQQHHLQTQQQQQQHSLFRTPDGATPLMLQSGAAILQPQGGASPLWIQAPVYFAGGEQQHSAPAHQQAPSHQQHPSLQPHSAQAHQQQLLQQAMYYVMPAGTTAPPQKHPHQQHHQHQQQPGGFAPNAQHAAGSSANVLYIQNQSALNTFASQHQQHRHHQQQQQHLLTASAAPSLQVGSTFWHAQSAAAVTPLTPQQFSLAQQDGPTRQGPQARQR